MEEIPTKDARIAIRATEAERERFRRAAARSRMHLSAWLRSAAHASAAEIERHETDGDGQNG